MRIFIINNTTTGTAQQVKKIGKKVGCRTLIPIAANCSSKVPDPSIICCLNKEYYIRVKSQRNEFKGAVS
jgi:hypothetical protein